jgi:hypothetical protein
VWALAAGLRFESAWAKFAAALVALVLVLALVRALAPPTAWDAMTYHLVVPTRYLSEGRIAAHGDNHFFGFPQGAELLYGVGMSAFGRDTVAAVVHFGFGLLGLLAVAGLARRSTDTATGWTTALLLMSAYGLWRLFGWPYVDLALMAYGGVALVAAVMWRETRRDSWLVALGALCGFALGVKYTGGALLGAVGVFVLVNSLRPRAVGATSISLLRPLLIVGGVVLAAFAPWLLKGLLFYGNPVYPFVFNGLNWDSSRAAIFSTTGDGLLRTGAWQLPVMPLAATVLGVSKLGGYDFTAGPWLFTAPFLLFLGWRCLEARTRRLALDTLTFALPMLLYWMASAAFTAIGMQTRLMTMLLPASALLGALALYGLARAPQRDFYGLVRGLLAATLILNALDTIKATEQEQAVPYLLASVSREDYLLADDTLNAFVNATNEGMAGLPAGSQVRLLWEPRGYPCPPHLRCVADVITDAWAHPLWHGAQPDDVLAAWRAAGDDYFLVWDTGYEFFSADPRFRDEVALWPPARDRALRRVWTDGVRYSLWTWRDPAP